MRVKITLCLFLALAATANLTAQCDGASFEEKNGILTIQAETASLNSSWQKQTSFSGFTGSGYINWTGSEYFNDPGNGLIQYKVKINSPGTYRFIWRSKVGIGSNGTEHNDTWLRIPDADDFYGQKGSSRIYPKGTGKSPNPAGSSSEGWFKIYMNSLNWSWASFTSDFDAHNIYVRFDKAGVYTIQLSARSRGHLIDRILLYKESVYSDSSAQSLSRPESLCDGGGSSSNENPNVTITSPTEGQNFPAGSDVTINLNSSDPDGSIVKHEIFLNGSLVDPDGAVYTPWTLQDMDPGNYTVRAVVTDDDGATSDDSVNFTVSSAASNSNPNVSITSPTNGQEFELGTDVTIFLNSDDPDGSIVKHEIFLNGSLVDPDGAVYTPWTLRDLKAGNYTVRAAVTDDDGAVSDDSVNFKIVDNNNDPGGSSISSLVLVDAGTNTDIAVITNGASFDSNTLPKGLSIRADTNPTDVSGVSFRLEGPTSTSSSEGAAPYHIFGDIGISPIGRELPAGSYSLTVNTGLGDSVSLSFAITDGGGGSASLDFFLIDAVSNTVTKLLSDGSDVADGSDINIIAQSTKTGVSSVVFQLSGTQSRTWTENFAPYALYGNSGDNYNRANLSVGNYSLRARFYSGGNGTGSILDDETINFTVSGSSKESIDTKAIAYPNPTPDGTLSVKFPTTMGQTIGYSLMSSSGQLLDSGTITNYSGSDAASLQISALDSSQEGVYYLTLTDGVQSYTIPVVRK